MDSLTLLAIFVIGTLLLAATKNERFFIVFMIRTRYFLNAIDRIASIAPRLWIFLADLAVVFSFGGLGGAYLSKKGSRKNLDIIFYFIGVLCILIWYKNPLLAAALLLALHLIVVRLRALKNAALDFLFSSAVVGLSFFGVLMLALSIFTAPGTSKSPNELIYIFSVADGMMGPAAIIIVSLLSQGYSIVFDHSTMPGISPLLPGTQEGKVGFQFPGYDIFVPIVFGVIALIVTLFAHEFAHGVLARVYKMKLKSTGILTFGIMPIGAFVEPDDEDMKKHGTLEKMHVFAAGSFSNMIVSFIAVAAIIAMMASPSHFATEAGVLVLNTTEGYPAWGALNSSTVILEVNGIETATTREFQQAMSGVKPGENVTLMTDGGVVGITTVANPEDNSSSFIGIIFAQQYAPGFMLVLIGWILFFNFNIALANLLPLPVFDGWRMLGELAKTLTATQASADRIAKWVVTATILIVLINVYPLFEGLFSAL